MAVINNKKRSPDGSTITPALQTPAGNNQFGEVYEGTPQSSGVPQKNINFKYSYSSDTKRNLAVNNDLVNKLVRTAQQVYGPSAVVDIYSGKQNPNKPYPPGSAGSKSLHVTGQAADVNVKVNGRKLNASELSVMGQAWLAQGYGGVGIGMQGGQGMHFDTGSTRKWYYQNGTWKSWNTSAVASLYGQDAANNLNTGLDGNMPNGIVKIEDSGQTSPNDIDVDTSRPVDPDIGYVNAAPTQGGDDGTSYGTFSTPDIGAKVWVFFYGGDPQKPVYFAQALDPSSIQQENGFGEIPEATITTGTA